MAETIRLQLNTLGTDLDDPGTTHLTNIFNKKAIWEIADSRIESFRIEGKSATGYYPWGAERPNPTQTTEEELSVPWLGKTGAWSYNIFWILKGETKERCFDPIISIKPSIKPLHIIVSLLGLTGFMYWWKKK